MLAGVASDAPEHGQAGLRHIRRCWEASSPKTIHTERPILASRKSRTPEIMFFFSFAFGTPAMSSNFVMDFTFSRNCLSLCFKSVTVVAPESAAKMNIIESSQDGEGALGSENARGVASSSLGEVA